MRICWAKHNLLLLLLTERYSIINTEIISNCALCCISAVCTLNTDSDLWAYSGATLRYHICDAARFRQRKLAVTFNHGCSLLAGGLSALHYRPILLQRMYSTAAGDRGAHITCRPLITQTRASSEPRPSAV